ncbi:MAG: hypothetical protein Q9169_008233, partial [Polycauliona sp. 2 TL-2023]
MRPRWQDQAWRGPVIPQGETLVSANVRYTGGHQPSRTVTRGDTTIPTRPISIQQSTPSMMQSSLPPYRQQPLIQEEIQPHEITATEQATLTQNRRNVVEAEHNVRQAQKNIDDFHLRIRQRRQADLERRASLQRRMAFSYSGHAPSRAAIGAQPSMPGLTGGTLTPIMTNGSGRKRALERHDGAEDCLDADQQGRRVRQRLDLGTPGLPITRPRETMSLISNQPKLNLRNPETPVARPSETPSQMSNTPSRKRHTSQRDGGDHLDADEQGRRVRQKMTVENPENPFQLNRGQQTGGLIPRRHVHPSDNMRASRSTNLIGSPQPFSRGNSFAARKMVGQMPSVNTTTQPPTNNFRRDQNQILSAHSLTRPDPSWQPHMTKSGGDIQSWADRSSSVVKQAFDSHPAALQSNQTPALGGAQSSLPPYQSPVNYHRLQMPDYQSSKLSYGALAPSSHTPMQSLQPLNDTADAQASKKRRRTTEVSPELSDLGSANSESLSESRQELQRGSSGGNGKRHSVKPKEQVYNDEAGELYIEIHGQKFYAAYHNDRRDTLLAREDAKGHY